MVFAIPLPADCKLYSGHDNDEQQATTTEQAVCIHQLKWMLYGDNTISTQASGSYLDGLAPLIMYVQCMLLDPLLLYEFDELVIQPINELVREGYLYKANQVCWVMVLLSMLGLLG